MEAGNITGYIDTAQLVLYAFFAFFAGLIYYLRTEDKREGYPLESERSGNVTVQGFPFIPPPKHYHMLDGTVMTVPRAEPAYRDIRATPIAGFPGAPLRPTGDPLVDAIGPAAYADRLDHPDLTSEGAHKIVPLRVASDYSVALRDADPRGMTVMGADGAVAGMVEDVWVDRSETIMRYLEVALALPGQAARTVLVPSTLVTFSTKRRVVKVKSLLAAQFANAPAIRDPDSITFLEEDRVCAYFGGGHLYAVPMRAEPLA